MPDHGIPNGPVRAFCIPGRHGSDEVIGTTNEGVAGLPEGWKLVRASCDDGDWVPDERSGARIVVCPEHDIS